MGTIPCAFVVLLVVGCFRIVTFDWCSWLTTADAATPRGGSHFTRTNSKNTEANTDGRMTNMRIASSQHKYSGSEYDSTVASLHPSWMKLANPLASAMAILINHPKAGLFWSLLFYTS